jgi:hypothetical protein
VAELLARLGARLPEKLAVWIGLAVGICVPYFLLQRFPLFRPRTLPETRVDHWIAFDPTWVWSYESIALLVPLAVLLAARADDLRRYTRGLALLCALSFAVFLVYPVAGPRPEVPPDHGMYRALVRMDTTLNSFPSLHAGLTAYSLLFAYRVVRDALAAPGRRAFATGAALWGTLILYGTLATKQHWAVDLPPGLLAGWLAHRYAWRGASDVRCGP